MFVAVLSFCLCLQSVFTNQLDLYENDICKQQDNQLWTCQRFSNCSTAQAKVKKGGRPEICSFIDREPIVCCQPPTTELTRLKIPERISSQKCREYAKYVKTYLENMVTGELMEFDTCAITEPLISNGSPAQPREYPHMALVGYGQSPDIRWLCGGSLISERFVISAAHCSHAEDIGPASWVRLGDYDRSSRVDDENRIAYSREYEIIERINHRRYRPGKSYHDIALFKLKENVRFDEYIRPICLQTKHRFPKTYAIATGWGTLGANRGPSAVLQKANLTIIGRKKCEDEYNSVPYSRKKLPNGIRDNIQLCAGGDKGEDTCQGDSGGPLQIRLADPYCMYSLVGIISHGDSHCSSAIPGMYTRVSHYVPWIESVVWP